MNTIANSVDYAGIYALRQTTHVVDKTLQGLLVIGEGLSQIMYDIYTIEGLLAISKFIIANSRLLCMISTIGDIFAQMQTTFEAARVFYYATLTFRSPAEFIKVDPLTGVKSLQLPQMRDGSGVDYVKMCYAIGGIFDTGRFLQKCNVYSFSSITQVGATLGSIQIYKNTYFRDLPILFLLAEAPKEFFFIGASSIEVWRWFKPILFPQHTGERTSQFKWVNIFKVLTSAGRLTLFLTYRSHSGTWFLVIVDVITQDSSLIKHLLLSKEARDRRYATPGAA